MVVAVAAWVTLAVVIISQPFSTPKLPIATANGTYANDCCGTILLRNGQMTVLSQQVSYVVERDKIGAYVLPTFYVGPTPRGIVFRRESFPLKMRLDGEAAPTAIQLMSYDDGSVFSFHRVSGN